MPAVKTSPSRLANFQWPSGVAWAASAAPSAGGGNDLTYAAARSSAPAPSLAPCVPASPTSRPIPAEPVRVRNGHRRRQKQRGTGSAQGHMAHVEKKLHDKEPTQCLDRIQPEALSGPKLSKGGYPKGSAASWRS